MAVSVLFWRRRQQGAPEGEIGGAGSASSRDFLLRFDREDALERLKDHSADHYTGLYNVMKGVTLAAAGLTLIRLTGGYPWQRLPLFAVGLLAIAITYNGALVGQTVVHLRTNLVDVLLPMALTVAEFVVIGMAGAKPKAAAVPEYWFLALGSWQVLAACVVTSVASRLREDMYSPTLWPTVRKYRRRQWIDACGAGASGAITLLVWLIFENDLTKGGTAALLLLLFTFVTLVGAMANHEQTRKELAANLRGQPAERAAVG